MRGVDSRQGRKTNQPSYAIHFCRETNQRLFKRSDFELSWAESPYFFGTDCKSASELVYACEKKEFHLGLETTCKQLQKFFFGPRTKGQSVIYNEEIRNPARGHKWKRIVYGKSTAQRKSRKKSVKEQLEGADRQHVS